MRATRLAPARQEILKDERALLGRIGALIARIDLPLGAQQALRTAIEQLDELFLLVIVGEFNAGKSAFINALLGQSVLPEGVTPTTTCIALLRYGETVDRQRLPNGIEGITAPVELLREINIVDTPGTNAVLRAHEELTRQFVPRADLVLFVTSADRPFTESERAFIEAIRSWHKKVLFAINKIDLLETAAERDAVVRFVTENAAALLGRTPDVFPLSARRALRARIAGDEGEVARSGFGRLEQFVEATLDEAERFRLKLRNPLGVARHVLSEALALVEGRIDVLKEDIAVVQAVDAQLRVYQGDIGRELGFRLADIEKQLLDFEKRGHAFFEEMLRLGRVFDLLNREKISSRFEREAVADLPRAIERSVADIVDWMAEAELRHWRGIAEQLARRHSAHADRLVGRVDGPFESSRAGLLENVRREAQRTVDEFDHAAESRRLAAGIREAVAGAALLQVGALGLGAAVTALASTTVADVTGLLAAGVLSVLGLLVLPARRKLAKKELGEKVAALRLTLMETLSAKTTAELGTSVRRIEAAMSPYTRFVRGERERLVGLHDELTMSGAGIDTTLTRIDAI